ncbi:MAG: helix-turn-helix domain-containing protein [Candidatus Rokubacteria bacterium]|nr:helix-turn-helix domain-containing protein [Candidatus Rokubacteria bacterium]
MRIEQDLAPLREQRRLSQRDLARILGVSQPAIAKLESGKAKNLQLKTLLRWTAASENCLGLVPGGSK